MALDTKKKKTKKQTYRELAGGHTMFFLEGSRTSVTHERLQDTDAEHRMTGQFCFLLLSSSLISIYTFHCPPLQCALLETTGNGKTIEVLESAVLL